MSHKKEPMPEGNNPMTDYNSMSKQWDWEDFRLSVEDALTGAKNVGDIINPYYGARGLKKPTIQDAVMFLMTELGEACEVLLSGEGYSRNNPQCKPQYADAKERNHALAMELGDVILMALVTGLVATGENPLACMVHKMKRKMQESRDGPGGNGRGG